MRRRTELQRNRTRKERALFSAILSHLGFDPLSASLFFAIGNSGEATVRYLDNNDQQQFKAPEIPNLDGAATYAITQLSAPEKAEILTQPTSPNHFRPIRLAHLRLSLTASPEPTLSD